MAKLIVKAGRNIGTEYKLNGDRMIMGRRSACPIPVADAKASREHAVIIQKDGVFYLQDLSRNGTLLNGQPAEKKEGGAPLKFGDQIRIGDTIMEMIDQSKETIDIEIPGYDILEKIGSGGMGIVFKARQRSMDRIVALKVLNERYSANAEFKDRFIREARAAGRLNHPNVIHVHDISSSNGRYYFSMEFIDGSSVKEQLRIERKMDVNKALDIVLQAAKALEFAHENRIVHRDIKPDNIMLTREGIVKIADLGIAKTFEDSAPSAKEHRRIMGTPHYMAPEQALGKAIDHRVDIYSLGATFYHMVTGSTPFNGSTAHEVLKAHIQESLPPIQDLNANVPDPVCFIIERMMAKLPEKRYPDMSKVIEDIERVQRGVIAGIHRIEAGDSTIMRALRAKSSQKAAASTPSAEDAADEAATGAHAPVNVGRMALLVALVFAAGVAIVLVVFKNQQNTGAVVNNTNTATSSVADTGTATGTGTGTTTPQVDAVAIKLLNEAKDLLNTDAKMAREKLQDIIKNHGPAVEVVKEANKLMGELDTALKKADRDLAVAAVAKAEQFEKEKPEEFQQSINLYGEALKICANQQDLRDKVAERIKELQKALVAYNVKMLNDDFEALKRVISAAETNHDFDSARPKLQKFIADHPNTAQKDQADASLKALNDQAQELFNDAKKKADGKDVIEEANKVWDEYNASVKDQSTGDQVNTERAEIKKRAETMLNTDLAKANAKAKDYNFAEAIKIVEGVERKLKGDPGEQVAKDKKDEFLKRKKFHEETIKLAQEAVSKSDGGIAFEHTEKIDAKWKITSIEFPGDVIKFTASNGGVEMTHPLSKLAAAEQYKFHKTFAPDNHGELMELCLLLGLKDEAELEKKAPPAPKISPSPHP